MSALAELRTIFADHTPSHGMWPALTSAIVLPLRFLGLMSIMIPLSLRVVSAKSLGRPLPFLELSHTGMQNQPRYIPEKL